jgi:hypothetical protein
MYLEIFNKISDIFFTSSTKVFVNDLMKPLNFIHSGGHKSCSCEDFFYLRFNFCKWSVPDQMLRSLERQNKTLKTGNIGEFIMTPLA